MTDAFREHLQRIQSEFRATYRTHLDWTNHLNYVLAQIKTETHTEALYHICDLPLIKSLPPTSPEWTDSTHMYEFFTLDRMFASPLTKSPVRETIHMPFLSRKFIISLHPLTTVLEKYLPGEDIDNGRKLSNQLFICGAQDSRNSAIVFSDAYDLPQFFVVSFFEQLQLLYKEFDGDIGPLTFHVCKTYDPCTIILQAAFFLFIQKNMHRRYNITTLIQKFLVDAKHITVTLSQFHILLQILRQFYP